MFFTKRSRQIFYWLTENFKTAGKGALAHLVLEKLLLREGFKLFRQELHFVENVTHVFKR